MPKRVLCSGTSNYFLLVRLISIPIALQAGLRNIRICQCGREEVDGSFDSFVQTVSSARLEVKGLQVKYEVPGTGRIFFGWEGPLTLDGQEISLRDYPRWENPYCQAEFNSRQYVITHNGMKLELDFERNLRAMT